jgi:L-fuconolactonase
MPKLYRRFGSADVKPLLDAGNVEGVVLIQAAPSVAETEYLLGIAESVPWILGVVGWVDFDAADAVDTMTALARNPKLVGIRPMLQDMDDPNWILNPRRIAVLDAIYRHQLVFDALIRPLHLDAIAQLAASHPQLNIVIDHAAKPSIGSRPDTSWVAAMQRISRYPNVACKLSGLLTELVPGTDSDRIDAFARLLLSTFAPHRVIWGSDWPVLTAAGTYAEWLRLSQRCLSHLKPDELHLVMGGNAIRTYRLKVH